MTIAKVVRYQLTRFLHLARMLQRRVVEWRKSAVSYLAAFLYRKNLPWRHIDNFTKLVVGVFLFISLMIILATYGALYSIPILRFLMRVAREVLGALIFLGNKLGLSDDFRTYVVGQVVADLISAAVIFVVAGILGYLLIGKFRQGLQFPTHEIRIVGRQVSDSNRKGVTTYYVKISNEKGDEPAPNCMARITFDGLTWRDVVNVEGARYSSESREFKGTNYFKTTTLSFRLPWPNHSDKHTILSGDYVLLPILRLIPATNEIPEHFEVPCMNELNLSGVGIGVCLRPMREYGEIRIIPERGRFQSKSFTVMQDSTGEWIVAV